MSAGRRALVARAATIGVALVLWVTPPPDGLSLQAWRLFAIFAASLIAVVIEAFPILTASVFAVAAAVLTGLVQPADAYAGFGNGTILLIVIAFLIADAVVKCGLGTRGGQTTEPLSVFVPAPPEPM